MTEGPRVQVKRIQASSWFGENRVKENEHRLLFGLVRALQEAAGAFTGITEDSLRKDCFTGRGTGG